ncbi:LemA family protein [Nitratireductor rhodophyticola]|uniref:LemA family protein n=1 Tax=Nitratireductor rhodophyticola TaxID=2854036 RepID=UPI00300ACC28
MSFAKSLAAVPARGLFPLLALCLLLPLLSACGFNTIPTREEQAKAAWSEVLNQYQRRADLIPNLVETVKGYAAQEREVLEGVVEARAKATQVQISPDMLTDPEAFKAFQESQAGLSGALSRLLAVVENYPDLKSSQNFLALQAQLEGTENRIAVARRDYIEAVRLYNTSLKTLPSMLWAMFWFTGNEPYETFTIPEDKMDVPSVNFGTSSGG